MKRLYHIVHNNITNTIYAIILIFGLFIFATTVSAQPLISGVSGTVGHGQSITISGSNFTSSGLMLYDNFETYSNGGVIADSVGGSAPLIHQGGLSSYTAWNYDCAGPSCGSYNYFFNNTSLRPNNTYHARTYFGTSNSWNQSLYLGYSLPAGNEIYISFYFRDTHSGGPRQMKNVIAYDSSWTNQWYFSSGYGNGCAPDNGWRMHEPSTPWENWFTFGADDTLNKWIRIDTWIKQSNSGTANGNWHSNIYRPTESPKSRGSEVSDNVVTYTGSATSRITLIGAYYDMCSGSPTANFDADNIYISTSRARVELCDSGTWSSRTHCELQVPTSWSTSSITATVDAGYFNTSDTAYLYVIDSGGNVSSAQSVTIGSGGGDTEDPTCTITSPTSGTTYDNGSTSTITIGGSATDNTGVDHVSWFNSATSGSGSCTGTTSWTCSAIPLANGSNPITVTSYDAAGNDATDTLTVTYTQPPLTDSIIDNGTPTKTSSTGSWSSSTYYTGYYGSSYLYSASSASDTYTWTETNLATGTLYSVYAWWVAGTGSRPTAADYAITHSGGTTHVQVNQNINGGVWQLLGTYTFGTTGSVLLTGCTGCGDGTVADAVRFTQSSDATAPTVTNVSSDKANGTYTVGEVIDIDVTFSEAVTSAGNVTVTLETGTTDRTCTFTVSNGTTGTCNYTVQAGDTSADLTVSTISGTIADQASNPMTNFVPATNLAANKALVIDAVGPVLSSVSPSTVQLCTSDPRNVIESFDTNENATCRAHDTETTWANMTVMTTTGTTFHSRTASRSCATDYSPNFICRDSLSNESSMSEANYHVNSSGISHPTNVGLRNVVIH